MAKAKQPAPDPALRAALIKAIKLNSLAWIAGEMKLARQTVERVMTGQGVYRGTLSIMTNWLQDNNYLR